MAYNTGASSGNLVLIQEHVASASASLTFTTGISGYDNYVLQWNDFLPATINTDLQLEFSIDGGASYIVTNYDSVLGQVNSGGYSQVSTTAFIYLGRAQDNSGIPVAGSITLYNLVGSGVVCRGSATFTAGGGIFASILAGTSTATAVNALRVISSSGNITSGTFKLYGVQK